ncbi:hypothetical protein KKH50_04755, partial [Patescibacteria group bacterium]|nr:hypothetical protein [Patescibacteria group bacterium]
MSSGDDSSEVRYSFLSLLSERLLGPTVTHLHGDLIARGRTIMILREALLSGEIPRPDALDWPRRDLRQTLIAALETANVGPYCDGDPEITDDVLIYLLDSVNEAHHLYERALVAFHALARKDQKQRFTLG